MVRDSVLEVIDFEGSDSGPTRKLTATEVLKLADIDFPTIGQAKECGALLRSRFGPPKKIQGIMRWTLPIRSGVEGDRIPDAEKAKPKSKFD